MFKHNLHPESIILFFALIITGNFIAGCHESGTKPQADVVSDQTAIVPAYKPEDCDLLLFKAYDQSDWAAVGNLYEPDAVFVLRSYKTIRGREAIRKMHASNAGLHFTNLGITTIYAQDSSIATTQCRYTYTYKDSTGKVMSDSSLSLEVVRKQADHTWRFLIDDPDGGLRIQIPSGK